MKKQDVLNALEVLNQASAAFMGTRKDHDTIHAAVSLLKDFVEDQYVESVSAEVEYE